MPTCISSQLEWLKSHAEQGEDQIWRCKTTGAEIKTAVVGRSIWERPFSGGSGEVRRVTHLACPDCNPNAVPPCYGEPIYEDELAEV